MEAPIGQNMARQHGTVTPHYINILRAASERETVRQGRQSWKFALVAPRGYNKLRLYWIAVVASHVGASSVMDDKYTGWRGPDVQFRHMLLLAAAIYAVWTPTYILFKPGPVTVPDGEHVQLILPTGTNSDDGTSVERLFGIRQQKGAEDPGTLVVYEDVAQLPADHYSFAPFNPKNPWRIVNVMASDGSDPRHNGRSYYAVAPHNGQGSVQASRGRTALLD